MVFSEGNQVGLLYISQTVYEGDRYRKASGLAWEKFNRICCDTVDAGMYIPDGSLLITLHEQIVIFS